ncbi:MAG: cytochrome P450 [Streptomycetaceae bacterium]|nr:cytochrome P450 [Streptomycetaceae bacterium]
MLAQGVILRRPRTLGVAARFDANRRADALLGELRRKYGPEPLLVRVGPRRVVLPLRAEDVHRVLHFPPDVMHPANREKRAVLGHFEPRAVLVTPGAVRAERRTLNELVLETDRPVHRLADDFHRVIRQEAGTLRAVADGGRPLDWLRFREVFQRIVRRIVLGDQAAYDRLLTTLLDRLRHDANWGYAHPRRRDTRLAFQERLSGHLDRGERGSLAAVLADTPAGPGADPYGQVPHWLFAYDAAGIAAYNCLALLAAHPEVRDRVRAGLRGASDAPHAAAGEPLLRACVLEALRLWPTTLVILRDSLADNAVASRGAAVAIVSSFFHRDRETLGFADRFTPDAWLDDRADPVHGIVPFSDGPAACPGRNLVLFTVTTLLAELLGAPGTLRLVPPHPDLGGMLPHTLDHTRLRFAPAGQSHAGMADSA